MDIVIALSVGCFLLLPYYLCMIIYDKKMIKNYIIRWLLFHSVFVALMYLMYNEWYSTPFIVLTACMIYYFFSYIFYVRDLKKGLRSENITGMVSYKLFKKVCKCIFFVVIGLAITDIILVFSKGWLLLEKIYLMLIISIAVFQSLYHYKKLIALYCIDAK